VQRSRRWLNTRLQRQAVAQELTDRSFLSDEIRSFFWTRYQDRSKALKIGVVV
jgi:hypothetical protein